MFLRVLQVVKIKYKISNDVKYNEILLYIIILNYGKYLNFKKWIRINDNYIYNRLKIKLIKKMILKMNILIINKIKAFKN